MPPHHPGHDPHRPSARDIRLAIDPTRIEQLLARWVGDPGERRFLARCIVDEGPAHHRGASYVILALLQRLLDRRPAPESVPGTRTVRVEMRLPPHLREQAVAGEYPLDLPLAALAGIVPQHSPEERALADCLIDGPAHHALANVAIVRAIYELALRLEPRA